MVNKKVALVVVFFVFLFSSTISYSYFKNQKGDNFFLSPIEYKPPTFNGGYNKLNQSSKEIDNEPKTEACPLNGALYSKTQKEKWEKRRPLGIMVENHTEARPQSGLSFADVVYEVVAEGGITRFLAIYYCQDAAPVGPVRSARIYFIKLLQEYGQYPLYAHVGGANTPGPADALGEIVKLGWVSYNDLNQFSVPFPYFWRDYERLPNRATEHTVYTSTIKLWQYAKDKRKLTNVDENGVLWNKNFTPWLFKDDEKAGNRGDINKVSFVFWNSFASDFKVDWIYNKEKNSYERNNGGKPHVDKNTGKVLTAKNVIIVFAKESPANDGYPGGHLLYKLIGSGNGLLFQDGKSLKISWQKYDEESRMKFYDEYGKEVNLVRGPIWIEILPLGNEVSY